MNTGPIRKSLLSKIREAKPEDVQALLDQGKSYGASPKTRRRWERAAARKVKA